MSKLILFCSLLALAMNSSGQRKDFIQFEARTAPFKEWSQEGLTETDLNDSVFVEAFEMSNLITWKQYKEFLADVKRMKGTYAYEQLLPKLPQEHLNNCLTTKKFDSSPVVGVTWLNANEYCKWRMVRDDTGEYREDKSQTSYRLPSQLEWISAYVQSKESKIKIDLESDYSTWTSSSYNEQLNYLKEYQYSAQKSDVPVMKRKCVMGSSFYLPTSDNIPHSYTYYQDSSYSHIGFRLVRNVDDFFSLDLYDDYLGDRFKDFWNDYDTDYLQDTTATYEFNAFYCQFYGRMNGPYTSFYPNGTQKSEGYYYKNQRTGNWIIWDSLGNKVIERNYLSPFRFEQIYPKIREDQARILRDARIIELARNEEGLLNYPYVQERSVLWSKRLWTRLEPEGNDQFFRKDRLINAIKLGVESGEIRLFDTNNDQFTDTISKSEFSKRLSGEVVAFVMKEDCFYDLDRGIASTRPIGICPIVVDTIDRIAIEREIAWIYFPDLRKILSTIHCYTKAEQMYSTLNYQRDGTSTKTLDDLFFFRDFNRRIVGTAHYTGKTTIPWEAAQNEDILLIEKEHDSWIELNSNSSSN